MRPEGNLTFGRLGLRLFELPMTSLAKGSGLSLLTTPEEESKDGSCLAGGVLGISFCLSALSLPCVASAEKKELSSVDTAL